MKKLLLSSLVMFFLCSVSFAQAKKQVAGNHAPIVLDQKAQAELEKKKLAEYKASQVKMTPEQEAVFQAEKLRKEQLRNSSTKAQTQKTETTAPKAALALVDPRAAQ